MKTKTKKFWALKKLDISYNPASINYINDKFKDIALEYTSQEKLLYNKSTLTLVCCCQNMEIHITFNKHDITKIQKM